MWTDRTLAGTFSCVCPSGKAFTVWPVIFLLANYWFDLPEHYLWSFKWKIWIGSNYPPKNRVLLNQNLLYIETNAVPIILSKGSTDDNTGLILSRYPSTRGMLKHRFTPSDSDAFLCLLCSEFFFRIKIFYFWILWSCKYIFLIIKINIFQGDLSDISANTATLLLCRATCLSLSTCHDTY